MSSVNGGNNLESFSSVPREWNDFRRFIEANYRVIYTVALAQVRDADIAQEIAQDVCVRLLLEREKLVHITNPSGWLARVARNTAIDWVRRRQTHSRALIMMESWNHNAAASAATPKDARHTATIGEENQRLYAALDLLPAEDREILLMHFMDGMDKLQIAGVLEIHPSTVGRRIEKSLRLMKKSLKDFQPESLATQLTRLRPTEHTSRSVLATLTAVAALGAAEKTALAAALAPLPILSAGAGVGAGTSSFFLTKTLSSLTNGLSSSLAGWGVPVSVGVVVLGFAAGIVKRDSLLAFVAPGSQNDKIQMAASDERGKSLEKVIVPAAGDQRSNTPGTSMQRGLVSDSTKVTYVPAATAYAKALMGTVTNKQGKTISQATVIAWIKGDAQWTSTTTTSDMDGKYELERLPEGSGYVTVDAAGYAHATVEEYPITMPWPAAFPLDIVLSRPVSLHGVVENEVGEPVHDATVIVAQESNTKKESYQGQMTRNLFETNTDHAGRFQFDALKPGYVILVTRHPDYAEDFSGEIASDRKTARVQLGHGVSLVGSVFDGETTVAHAEVVVKGGNMNSHLFGNAKINTDENGNFVATNLPIPGNGYRAWPYSVMVNRDSGATVPLYSVFLDKDKTTHTLAMNAQDERATETEHRDRLTVNLQGNPLKLFSDSAPKGTARVSGTIELPEGVWTASVTVSITDKTNYHKSVSAENLSFSFDQVIAGEMTVSAKTDPGNLSSFNPQQITVREGDVHTVDLKCGTGSVKGRVLNRAPGQRYYLTAYTVDPVSPLLESGRGVVGGAFAEDDGSFLFRGLLPGDYFMEVTGPTEIMSQAFHSKPGQTAVVDITLPDAVELTGSVIDSLKNKPIPDEKLMITSGHWNSTGGTNAFDITTDKEGRFKCQLTVGYYKAILRGPTKMIDFHVTTATTIIPPIDLRTYSGQILVKNRATPPERGAGKLDAQLVNLGEGGRPGQRILDAHAASFGNDFVMLKNLQPGRYGLIVKSGFAAKEDQQITTVFVPEVEVTEDKTAVIEIEVAKAAQVELICQPGKYMAYWENPRFWVRDGGGSGAKMPVSISNEFSTELGLAPGSYQFGLTMDSGEEQSKDFEVTPGADFQEVVLRLR